MREVTDGCWDSTTSGLALIPLPRCANYSASKAALHSFILCLREQLKSSPQIKVVELFPPAVQSKSPSNSADSSHQLLPWPLPPRFPSHLTTF